MKKSAAFKSIGRTILFLLAIVPVLMIGSCQKEQFADEEVLSLKSEIIEEGEFVTYWGEETFTREDGKPKVVTMKIGSEDLQHFEDCFVLKIKNGNEDGTNRVSSAIIRVDGQEILGTMDFSLEVDYLEKEICGLTEESEIEVELRSEVGSFICVWVEGVLLSGHAQLNQKGGIVILQEDNIEIEFPEGAVQTKTYISIKNISKPIPENIRPKNMVQYEMLPNGLTFLKPIVLTVPYYVEEDKNNLPVIAYNMRNGIWEDVKILNTDRLNKKVKLEIKHFTISLVGIQDNYIVVDIPGKYLKKADLLYCLTGIDDFDWFPGHAAMYLGTDNKNDSEENDGNTIIESTPRFPPLEDGVDFGKLSELVDAGNHLFMGARRYDGNITNEQRQLIAKYAIEQIGDGYWAVGQGNWQDDNFSCVGLTEKSYEEAGLNIVPLEIELPWLYPYNQFKRTKPIDEITVKCGDEIILGVYGVSINNFNKFHATNENIDYTSNIPSEILWNAVYDINGIKDYNEFSWTPIPTDIGKTYNVNFKFTTKNILGQDIVV